MFWPSPSIDPISMQPTPNPSQVPPRLDGADIAVADAGPKLPSVAASPRRLFARDGGTDGCSERPPKSIDPRPSPRRAVAGAADGRSGPSPAVVVAWDAFAPSPPRPSDRRATPARAGVVVSPDQAKRIGEIVARIHSTPVSQKRAVLPRTTKVPPPKRSVAGPAEAIPPDAKPTAARPTQKKESILSSDFFPQVRPHIFGATKQLQYSKIEMEKHDRFFQKQLKFRFDEKRKSKQKIAAGEGRSLRSHVDNVVESFRIIGRATKFHRYVSLREFRRPGP